MHSFLLVGLLLGQSPAPKSSVAELSPSKVFTLRAPATFVVVVGERQGSAVAYAEKRLATNAHVVGDAKEVVLRQGAESWKGRVLAVDEVRDVALIESERALPALAPLRKDEPAIGERVFAIGAPQGLELSLSDGLVSGLREEDGLRWLQTTAPISPGSSGGGLFDSQGRLVGLTTMTRVGAQNLNFAVPAQAIAKLTPNTFRKAETPKPRVMPKLVRCSFSKVQVWSVLSFTKAKVLEEQPANQTFWFRAMDTSELQLIDVDGGEVALPLNDTDERGGRLFGAGGRIVRAEAREDGLRLWLVQAKESAGAPRFLASEGRCIGTEERFLETERSAVAAQRGATWAGSVLKSNRRSCEGGLVAACERSLAAFRSIDDAAGMARVGARLCELQQTPFCPRDGGSK